jgi:hypothetical protein
VGRGRITGGGGGRRVRPHPAAESKRLQKWRKNKCFKGTKIDFLPSTNFKLLSQTQGNTKHFVIFFKFIISVRADHMCLLAPGVKKLATPKSWPSLI